MKKNLLSVLALILALVSLAVALLAHSREPVDYSVRITALEEENLRLREDLAALSARLEEKELAAASGGLASWTMDITPWESSTGADILIRAVPETWHEGLAARIVVQLGGQEILNAACTWDGTAFTATAPLEAADGYGYYLVLDIPDGTRQSHAMTTPEDPALDIPVYLASSLTTYCNLIVDGWEATDQGLTLKASYIQVQLPRISAGGAAGVESARLVLLHNGSEVHDVPLILMSGETSDSYELALHDLPLPLPGTEADDLLELRLEVILSNGTELTSSGITWFQNGDKLDAVVG